MDHVGIMNKNWGMIEKILSGNKRIESRWYTQKGRRPNVNRGDTIYFRNSGQRVIAKASALKVLYCDNLTPTEIHSLLSRYGKDIGIPASDFSKYEEMFKEKKFAVLIFLSNPQSVAPFNIDKMKAGYCSRAAWVSVDNIKKIVSPDN